MAGNVALVRRPSSRMAEGITTHIDRVPADAGLAARQHEAYVAAVAGAGWTIREVPAADELPDGTFVASDLSLFDPAPFPTVRLVPEEAGSHVVPLGGGTLVMGASAPRSAELFDDLGFDVVTVDIGEFEKREGCVTCLSVLV